MTARKPSHLKAIAGTDQPCRRVEEMKAPPMETLPDAPDWLPNAHAVKEFERMTRVLHAHGVLSEVHCSVLAVAAGLFGKMQQLFAAGEVPTGHMVAQYVAILTQFGLTPVSSGKVAKTDSKKAGNKFANRKLPAPGA